MKSKLVKFVYIACLFYLTIPPATLPAFPFAGEVSVGGWRQSPHGYVSYKSDDRIGLQDVLNYDDETRLFGRVKAELPRMLPNIYLMVAPMKFAEASTVDDFYDFGDIIIIPGIDFTSKLVLNHYDIGLYYDIPLPEKVSLRHLRIEAGVNTRIVDATADVTQDTLLPGIVIKEYEEELTVIPMLYLGIFVQPTDRVSVEGEFRGLSFSDNDIYSLIGRLKFILIGPVFVAGGYRYDDGDSDYFDFRFDVDFSGPFLESGVRF